jgi:tetratricopeptide (TPR) repeat protein
VLLGDIQASLLKDSAAEESFRQALAIEPDNEEAMFNLAVRLRSSGTDDSVSLLEHATRVDPLYAAAHRELGFERLKRRELARAEHQLRTALALEPDDVWTHLYLGNVFWLSGRLTEAEDQLVRATELAPFWAAPNWLVGMFYAATGQTDRADRAFRLAASVEQRDAEAAYQLARYLLDTGFIAEGKQWLTRALELDPDHRRARALSESSPGKSGEN